MSRVHTLSSIASELNRDKRTVQTWYQKAKAESGEEIGEIINGIRHFSDSERSILVSYAGADRPTKAPATPTVTVETGNHQIVLSTPELPQTYSLEGLRVSESVGFDDPLAVAQQFLQVADKIQTAMQTDIEKREQKLHQTKQAKQKIATKAQELRLEQRFYQERTRNLDTALSDETQDLQTAIEALQKLGKPQDTPAAG
jgi:flagellar biosynthesis GTPase FlhF